MILFCKVITVIYILNRPLGAYSPKTKEDIVFLQSPIPKAKSQKPHKIKSSINLQSYYPLSSAATEHHRGPLHCEEPACV